MELEITKIETGYLIQKRDDTSDYAYTYSKFAFTDWGDVVEWVGNNPVS